MQGPVSRSDGGTAQPGHAGTPDSPGERLFAAYLRQRSLSWTFEEPIAERRPDFCVKSFSGDVVCEVYEPEIRLPSHAGTFDAQPALRKAFRGRKAKQAQAARNAGLAFMLVLVETRCDLEINPAFVAGAMYGDLGMSFVVGSGTELPDDDPHNVFLGGARLQEDLNTSVSAVAVLQTFNPTFWKYELASRELARRLGKPRDVREAYEYAIALHEKVFGHMISTGAIDDDAKLARLIVLHNWHARYPIDLDWFGGPHDEQWGTLEVRPGATEYGLLAEGRLRWEVSLPL